MHIAYQPIWDLKRGRVFGYEALLRPDNGIPPQMAILRARHEGTITDLDTWVITRATTEAAQWLKDGEVLFVNVEPETMATLSRWNSQLSMPPERIVIELTERSIMDGLQTGGIRADGVRLALDDFGTGYSNLLALESLRPDFVKVDRSFLIRHAESGVLSMLARSSHELGMQLIVEGVENEDDLAFIERLPIRYAQGFYLGRPVPVHQVSSIQSVFVSTPP